MCITCEIKLFRKGSCKDSHIYAYLARYTHLHIYFTTKDKKQSQSSQSEKSAAAVIILSWPENPEPGFPRFSCFFFCCEYCTTGGNTCILSQMYLVSSHSAPGRDSPGAAQTWCSSCTKPSNSKKSVISFIRVSVTDETYAY